MSNPDQKAGSLLAALRKRAGVTQDELAEKLNIGKTTLSYWENGHFPIATDKLPGIATALSLSPQELHKLTVTRLPLLKPARLARQKPGKEPGRLLAAFRQRAGLSQDALAQRIAVTKPCICYWETGQVEIDAGTLPRIAAALKMSQEDVDRLTIARLPALDPAWLAQQEPDKRLGLLMAAFREQAGLTQEDLAAAVGLSSRHVVSLESGEGCISAAHVLAMAEALKLAPAALQRLVFVRWPALEPGWLAGQEPNKQACLLLTAFRERAGLTQEELADATGVSIRTVIRWESGQARVSGRYADTLVEHYQKLSDSVVSSGRWFDGVEAKRLRGICAMSRAARKRNR